jgi:hypothetical protein
MHALTIVFQSRPPNNEQYSELKPIVRGRSLCRVDGLAGNA